MNQDSAITWPVSHLKCFQIHIVVEYEKVYKQAAMFLRFEQRWAETNQANQVLAVSQLCGRQRFVGSNLPAGYLD